MLRRSVQSTKNVCQRPFLRTASCHSLSNIEMAFDVLMHDEEGRDLDVVECEEFIDQCKAYAAELTEEQNRCEYFNSRNAFQDIMNSFSSASRLEECTHFALFCGRLFVRLIGFVVSCIWLYGTLRSTPCNALSFAW